MHSGMAQVSVKALRRSTRDCVEAPIEAGLLYSMAADRATLVMCGEVRWRRLSRRLPPAEGTSGFLPKLRVEPEHRLDDLLAGAGPQERPGQPVTVAAGEKPVDEHHGERVGLEKVPRLLGISHGADVVAALR